MPAPTRPRRLVPAASAVIVNDLGQVLLVRRGREPQRGLWSVPGGHVERGETFQDAARREALEETGLRVRIGRELWRLTSPTGDGGLFDIRDFAATVVGGELRTGDDADALCWAGPEELASLPLTDDLDVYLRRAGIAVTGPAGGSPAGTPPG
nr:NUDIX domain-containing protein [Actinomyces sp.]